MSDTLEIFGQEYTDVTGFKATDDNDNVVSYTSGGGSPTLETVTKTYTPSTSAVTDTITPSSGYDGIGEVGITVSAVSTGSATTPATTVTANPSISVNSSGLITASVSSTKSVTPTVSEGYVSSGTAGTITVSGSNTSQLTTQAAQTIYPSSSDQTISSGKYLTGTQTIKAVTTTNLTAANIKKDVVVQVGDSSDSDRVVSVTGTYEGSGGSSMNVQAYMGYDTRKANSYGATAVSLTVAKAGTYDISWCAWRGSSSGTMGTNLHIGSTAESSNHETWTGTYGQCITLTGKSLTANQTVTVYATSGSNSRSVYVGNLVIKQTS